MFSRFSVETIDQFIFLGVLTVGVTAALWGYERTAIGLAAVSFAWPYRRQVDRAFATMRAESKTSVVIWADIPLERLIESAAASDVFAHLKELSSVPPEDELQSWQEQILIACREKFGSDVLKVKFNVMGNLLLVDEVVVPRRWVDQEWLIPHPSFFVPDLSLGSFDPEEHGFRVRLILVNGMLRLQIWRGPWRGREYKRLAWTTVRSFPLMWQGIHLPLWAYGLDYHIGSDSREARRAFFRDCSDYRYMLASEFAVPRWEATRKRFFKKRDDWLALHEIEMSPLGSGSVHTTFDSRDCRVTCWDASGLSQMDILSDKETRD